MEGSGVIASHSVVTNNRTDCEGSESDAKSVFSSVNGVRWGDVFRRGMAQGRWARSVCVDGRELGAEAMRERSARQACSMKTSLVSAVEEGNEHLCWMFR